MTDDTMDLVDTTCSVCGAGVRGEKVPWLPFLEGGASQEDTDRLIQAGVNKNGGYVCGKCGTVLCDNTHKAQVENTKMLRGYRDSPCPGCGSPLRDGFVLLEAPEGSFEATPVAAGESPDSGDPEGAGPEGAGPDGDGSDDAPPAPPSIESIRWDTESVSDGTLAFPCPQCEEKHTYSAALFKDPPEEGVEGFTSTEYRVNQGIAAGLGVLASFAVAVTIFVWVHKAMFGPQITPGVHLVIPALAAVFSFSLVTPVTVPIFAAMPFIPSRKIPVYGYTCGHCGCETYVACDGEKQATPEKGEGD